MDRTAKFVKSTMVGYGSIAANVIYTIASVPIALNYLDNEQFGLWALAVQMIGYLNLLDLGMSNSMNRFIADHKDDPDGGIFGQHLKTAGAVYLTQAAIITISGCILAFIAPYFLTSASPHGNDLKWLILSLSLISGISVASRAIGSPLWAFQRLDVINFIFTAGTVLSLLMIWLGFSIGLGVMAFPVSMIPGTLLPPFVYYAICRRNGYYPAKNKWGRACYELFKKMFSYGKSVFSVQLGNQLINASQIIIISKVIGLKAAAAYAIATKSYTLGMMLLSNPIASAAPGLAELHIRQNHAQFERRFWHLITLTLFVAVIISTGIATGNSLFVSIWTSGVIHWPVACDIFVAIMIVLRSLCSGSLCLFESTKSLQKVRYIYLYESIAFIPMACMLGKWYGITGVIGASILSNLIITTPILIMNSKSRLTMPPEAIRTIVSAIILVTIAGATRLLADQMDFGNPASIILICASTFIAIIGGWKLILPIDLRYSSLQKFKQILKS